MLQMIDEDTDYTMREHDTEAMVAGYAMRAESDDPAVLVYDIGEGNPRRGDG